MIQNTIEEVLTLEEKEREDKEKIDEFFRNY
jgi:hypothetical protein